MSDARRYAVWPEPMSRSRSLKGSRPSVPMGLILLFGCRLPRSWGCSNDRGIQEANTVHVPGLYHRFELKHSMLRIAQHVCVWFLVVRISTVHTITRAVAYRNWFILIHWRIQGEQSGNALPIRSVNWTLRSSVGKEFRMGWWALASFVVHIMLIYMQDY